MGHPHITRSTEAELAIPALYLLGGRMVQTYNVNDDGA